MRLDLDDACEAWPDNYTAATVFIHMSSQWRTGMGGPTGLDYNALPVVLRMTGVHRSEWPDVFDCIRVMEGEAMKVMGEQA